MNVFDFDGTIYKGNSSVDFFAFCMFRNFKVLFYAPISLLGLAKYKLKLLNLENSKDLYCKFLKHIDDIDKEVENFWNNNIDKIQEWYLNIKKSNDLIITSSPDFLIKPLCARLGVTNLIATEVDLKSAKIIGKVCTKEEKLRRFKEVYGSEKRIKNLYIDSDEDNSLVNISDEVYVLKKGKIKSKLL
jgi:phosphoserine phosphatase